MVPTRVLLREARSLVRSFVRHVEIESDTMTTSTSPTTLHKLSHK